jgi:hypothetical protein
LAAFQVITIGRFWVIPEVWMIAVMHGHRSPRVMAAILRSREDYPR